MMDHSTITAIIAILSFILNLVVILRKGSTENFDRHLDYKLSKFKDDFIEELNSTFVNARLLELEFKLRDAEIISLKDQLKSQEHRTNRNTQIMTSLLEAVLNAKLLTNDKLREIHKENGE